MAMRSMEMPAIFVALLSLGCAALPFGERPARTDGAGGAASAAGGAAAGRQDGFGANARPARPRVAPRISPDAAFRQDPPHIGALPRLRIAPQSFRTPHGLSVLVFPSRRVPLVSVELVVPGGAGAEPREQAGLAHLAASIPGLARQSVQGGAGAALFAAGGQARFAVDWNAMRFSLTVPRERLDEALGPWVDSLIGPRPDPSTLQTAIDRARFATSAEQRSGAEVAAQVMTEALFGPEHRYSAPLAGDAQSLARIGPEAVVAHLRRELVPTGATLIVAGDITVGALEPRLGRLLADWKAPTADHRARGPGKKAPPPRKPGKGRAPASAFLPPAPAATDAQSGGPTAPRIVLVDRPASPVVLARVGVPLDGAIDGADGSAATSEQVLETLMSGPWGRLDRSLRHTRGWALQVFGQRDERLLGRTWLIGADLLPEHAPAALEELVFTLTSAHKGPLTQREVEDARRARSSQLVLEARSALSLASTFSRLLGLGQKPDAASKLVADLAKVDAASVERVAAKVLDPRRWVLVVVGARRRLEAPLRRLGPLELRDGDGLPASETPRTTLRDRLGVVETRAFARR